MGYKTASPNPTRYTHFCWAASVDHSQASGPSTKFIPSLKSWTYFHIVKVKSLSHVQLFATLWTVAYQVPLSMGFSRQEYWSGLPFPSPGDLPNPGIEPRSLTLQADTLPSEPPGKNPLIKPNTDETLTVF